MVKWRFFALLDMPDTQLIYLSFHLIYFHYLTAVLNA